MTVSRVPPPTIERSITLNFQGDWGRANLHRTMGWLCYELGRLSGPYTRIGIFNGVGGMDAAYSVGRGQIDVALMTPAWAARLAFHGSSLSGGESFPHLRALGNVPQNDRMILAIDRAHGIRSFAELRELQPKLIIAAGRDDGINLMGFGAQAFMSAADLPRERVEGWGASYREHDEPLEIFRDVIEGRADAIIMEAVMSEFWAEMADKVDLYYLPVEESVKARLMRDYRWPTASLPAHYQRGLDEESEFLDFSDFILLTTTDLPEDVAYSLAWSLVERYEGLARQYRHIPSERSPVNYPIDPKAACRTSIPLHPGARRYFRDAGHLD